jgi:predicted metal-dependent hydrolase
MNQCNTKEGFPVDPIVRRDLRFDLEGGDVRHWHPEGLHVAHFFNALSLLFPEGESFFIDSVRHFRDRIRSPQLAADVQGFLGQEAMHSREHRRYNAALAAAGLPARALEDRLRRLLDELRARVSPEEALAITIALEHFTAIMADVALGDPRNLAGADERFAAIWRWHAAEETEHKAVAYDVYREVVGEDWRAYLRRVRVMLLVTIGFWIDVTRFHLRLVHADGALGDLRGWWRLWRFLWIRPGGMRRVWRLWLGYFRPGFHPWQLDNRHHVEAWKAAYAPAAAPA